MGQTSPLEPIEKPVAGAGRRAVGALALFVGLSVLMLYPLSLHPADQLRDLGDPLEYAWVLGYSAQRLVVDPLRLYAGNIFFPYQDALAFSDSTITNTLLALPVVLTTGNPVLASNLLLLLSFVLCGFGAYLLVTDLTGSALAGIVAGVVFAFNPFRMDHLSQIPNASAEWMPLAFWALRRFLAGRTRWWVAAFGAFLALQMLSSFYYAYAFALALAVYLLGLLIARPRRLLRWPVVLPLLAVGAVVGALFLTVSLPYFGVADRYEMRRDIGQADFFAIRPRNLLGVTSTNRTWGHILVIARSGANERTLFPGLVALGLAGVGLALGRPRLPNWLFFVAGLGALALAFGPTPRLFADGPPIPLPFPTPYQVLFDYLPGFQALRVPARFGIGAMLALCVLAGSGAAWVIARARRAGPRVGLAVAALLVLGCLGEYFSAPIPTTPIETGSAVPPVYGWLRDQPDRGVIVELPIDTTPLQARYEYFSTYHNWTLVNGYRAFVPPGYTALAATLQGFPSADSLDLLADLRVRYVVVHADRFSADDRARYEAALGSVADRVRLTRQFGPDFVYEVSGAPAAPWRDEIPPPYSLSLVSACSVPPGQLLEAGLVAESANRPLVALPSVPGGTSTTAVWTSTAGKRLEQSQSVRLDGMVLEVARRFPLALTAPQEPGDYRLAVTLGGGLSSVPLGSAERLVHVGPESASAGASVAPLQVTSFETIAPAVRADSSVVVRIRWKARAAGVQRGSVFVNVYDDSYRYWSVRPRAVLGETIDGVSWCANDERLDVREVALANDTPPGYYHVEVGLLDPTSGRRLPILSPDGRLVETVVAAPLRIAASLPDARGVSATTAVGATFGDAVRLEGWRVLPAEPTPGSTARVALLWSATRPPAADYSLFVHVYDSAGRLVAQHDGPPGAGAWPTSRWQPGDKIEDSVDLSLPAALPPGSYTLGVGVYEPASQHRLPQTAGPTLGDDRALAGQIQVVPPPAK